MPQQPAYAPGEGKTIKAAGAVAWRRGPGGSPEFLLVHRPAYGDWSLPKGKAKPGEPLPVTALREVYEETGARLTLGRRLAPARYKVNGRPKRVGYWTARVTGVDDGAVPNHEVDEIAWLPPDAARARVSYSRDREVIDDFAAAPEDTVPLILLRHAKAEPKDKWADDDARPLSEAGRDHAAALAAVLACFAPRARVFTSPALRCAETVRPYAALTGARVLPASGLRISGTDNPGSSALLASVLEAETPAILCAHRENLPRLIMAAAAALGAAGLSAAGAGAAGREPDCAPLPTAGFCVLHVAAGKLAAADRYDLSDG